MSIALLKAPDRLNETWDWFCAVCAYDYGEPSPLAELVCTHEVPAEYRQAVADIITGARQPNRRAAAKLKLPADEMLQIAGAAQGIVELVSALKYGAISQENPDLRGASAIGWDKALEPTDVMRELEGAQRQTVADTAAQLGVSTETVENLLRELRRRVNNWPVV